MSFAPVFAAVLFGQAPTFLAWIVGLVVAVTRWSRHPQVSLATVVAIGLAIVLTATGTMLSVWLPFHMRAEGRSIGEVGQATAVIALTLSTLQAGNWVLVFVAIFGWRSASATALPTN